jgi:starch phosphorylase
MVNKILMEDSIQNIQADKLISKIKHYLITMMGTTLSLASEEEFYRAFSWTIREEIMINWAATKHTMRKADARTLYYLCMEYMPGKFLGNNITNIHAKGLVEYVLKKLGKSYSDMAEIEPDPALGNGGLGRLASCLMDSLATQQYPAMAYGLRYQYGIFEQELWNGVQVEKPDTWLLHENPWEFRRDEQVASVSFAGDMVPLVNTTGLEVYDLKDAEEVRAMAYDIPIVGYRASPDCNVLTMRLWTTKESPRNFQLQRFNAGLIGQAAENTSLTDVLYPNDNNEVGKRLRLKQEFLLTSASMQDILGRFLQTHPNLSTFADKTRIQINDTHPALAIAELMRLLTRVHHFGWNEAFEVVKTCFSFTNHTILKEALEEWKESQLKLLLPRQYQIIEKLNFDFCSAIRQKYAGDEERVRRMSIIEKSQVKMAYLAVYGSHHVNGVSSLHSEILKNTVFKDFNDLYPGKFINITNGVTPRRFLLYSNPLLADFISARIGNAWITNFKEIRNLDRFALDKESQEQFLAIKQYNKQRLLDYLRKKSVLRDNEGQVIGQSTLLGSEALFDVQIKRIHEYKRQLMSALHLLMLYQELKTDPSSRLIKRMVLFAGKAAPGYEIAKNIILLICCIARRVNSDERVNTKLQVVFIENYNATRAEYIIPAADLSEQVSTAGTEASGTGNMKLAMNGALTIGTADGANVEMRESIGDKNWPFCFGKTTAENAATKGSYNPWDIYLNDSSIRQAVDTLKDRSLADSEAEHQSLLSLYHNLLGYQKDDRMDRYGVLSDLRAYYDTQKKVEELYLQPFKWAEMALNNIAGMGCFSSDETVHNYARKIWEIEPCPMNLEDWTQVRAEYSEHDQCRIL